VQAHEARCAVLAQTAARRKARPLVQQAVRRAADRYLTAAIRSATAREQWARLLHGWLRQRHSLVGLERCPCINTVRTGLSGWTPTTYGNDSARVQTRAGQQRGAST